MARKRKTNEEEFIQLSLFDEQEYVEKEEEEEEENDDSWLSGDDDEDDDFARSNRTVEIEQELITLKLLRQAIVAQNPNDKIMADFAEYVLPNLVKVAIGVTAKGGKFFEKLYAERGRENVRRDNAGDQSLSTHLLNGLFPANLIEQRLEKLNTTVRRVIGETERRILIAGFILHDFEKFPDTPDGKKGLSLDEQRQIIDDKVRQLGLDKFINSDEQNAYQEYLDDLVCVALNAQVLRDTNLNFSDFGLSPKLRDRTLECLSNLSRLADLFASVIKHPQDVNHSTLKDLIYQLSDGQLKLTYHSIAENRGILTNVVNNALIEAYTKLNTDDITYYEPLLYLPTGVIYLAQKDAPPIATAKIPDLVIQKIKKLCQGELIKRQIGFGRDGKGMKYAEYYEQFFNVVGLMQVALKATLSILKPGKSSVAKSRSDSLVKYQQQKALSSDYDFSFGDDIRIDQLAEFGDVITRKIWGREVEKIEQVRKQNKKLPKLPDLDLIQEVAKFWELEKYQLQIREIQRINESLKELKIKGNTGGLPLEWYFLAAKYLENNPGIEDVTEICEQLINHVAQIIEPILAQYELPDGWDDVRIWVQRVVMLPEENITQNADIFLEEFNNYQLAKKSGRGRKLICSISHSSYTVKEQMESAVLFTPQVYTNKQMLGGSNAKRNISSIAGLEIMLRQILMNQTKMVGKSFEDQKYRYLYFYPTYYFTPETNKFLSLAYQNIAQTRFKTNLRNHFISDKLEADFSRSRYQSVAEFLLDKKEENKGIFKLSYPEEEPMTFYFMAMPPGKDGTDTESWVMPCWLGLAFPMILDVKTVVSESPIPPFLDGNKFEETVFLDSAPLAFQLLTNNDKFRLDYILEGWEDKGEKYSAPLNVLTAAYAIHLDVNPKQGKSGYDSNWGKLAELANDFATSPLYVFNYLNRWVRKPKKEKKEVEKKKFESASIEKIKLYAYAFYPCFDPYVDYDVKEEKLIVNNPKSALNHPQKLTELYRKFYRAKKQYNPKSNAVLKPIDEAKNVILNADPSFQGETLVFAVAAKVNKLMDRVHANTAEGYWILKNREEEREAVLDFARYFVEEVFEKTFAGDRARLAGKQINLICDTCEFLYRLENDKDIKEKGIKKDEEE